eukprot:SAG31_NODE_30515_length_380_cov_0.701068_1_plen_70_part_01
MLVEKVIRRPESTFTTPISVLESILDMSIGFHAMYRNSRQINARIVMFRNRMLYELMYTCVHTPISWPVC